MYVGAWTLPPYQRWLPHLNELGITGYFRAEYHFSVLAELREQIAELSAGEGCTACHL